MITFLVSGLIVVKSNKEALALGSDLPDVNSALDLVVDILATIGVVAKVADFVVVVVVEAVEVEAGVVVVVVVDVDVETPDDVVAGAGVVLLLSRRSSRFESWTERGSLTKSG